VFYLSSNERTSWPTMWFGDFVEGGRDGVREGGEGGEGRGGHDPRATRIGVNL